METKVKEALKNIDSVCTKADVWTAHNRSYFGKNVHWIDPVILNHSKAAIRCTRIYCWHICMMYWLLKLSMCIELMV